MAGSDDDLFELGALGEGLNATYSSLAATLESVFPELSRGDFESRTLSGILDRLALSGEERDAVVAAWEIQRGIQVAEFEANDEALVVEMPGEEDVGGLPADLKASLIQQLAGQLVLRSSAVLSAFPDHSAVGDYLREVNKTNTPPTAEYFLQFLLSAGFSAFESHVFSLARVYFSHRRDDVVRASVDPEFSLAQLMELGSLEEALELAIDERLERFQFRGFRGWADWFRSQLEIDWSELAFDWDFVTEALERRHCVMHNGGRATRKYLRTVPEHARAANEVGERLFVTPEYVRRVSAELNALGLLLAHSLWKVLVGHETPEDREQRSNFVVNGTYDLLRRGLYREVGHAADVAIKRFEMSDENRLLVQCNRWIALKSLGKPEGWVADVRSWDARPLAPKFQLAKAALLDEVGLVEQLVPRCIEIGDMTATDLKTWPLFEFFRESVEYSNLIQGLSADEEE